MPAGLLWRIAIQILHEQRPRPYQTHVSTEYVPKLRQLIEARSPEKTSQPRDALFIWQKLALLIALVCHASEFEREKRNAHVARTLLAKQSWTAHVQPYYDGNCDQQW